MSKTEILGKEEVLKMKINTLIEERDVRLISHEEFINALCNLLDTSNLKVEILGGVAHTTNPLIQIIDYD